MRMPLPKCAPGTSGFVGNAVSSSGVIFSATARDTAPSGMRSSMPPGPSTVPPPGPIAVRPVAVSTN